MYTMVYYSTYIPLLMMTIFVVLSSLRECCKGKQIQFTGNYGVESDAIILNIELIKVKETGSLQKIKFWVHVQPYDKRSYVTEFDQITNSFPVNHLEVGAKIRIRYDPKMPKNVRSIKGC